MIRDTGDKFYAENKEKIVFEYKRKKYEVVVQPHSFWVK